MVRKSVNGLWLKDERISPNSRLRVSLWKFPEEDLDTTVQQLITTTAVDRVIWWKCWGESKVLMTMLMTSRCMMSSYDRSCGLQRDTEERQWGEILGSVHHRILVSGVFVAVKNSVGRQNCTVSRMQASYTFDAKATFPECWRYTLFAFFTLFFSGWLLFRPEAPPTFHSCI